MGIKSIVDKAHDEEVGAALMFNKIVSERPSVFSRFIKKWVPERVDWERDIKDSRCSGDYIVLSLPKRLVFGRLTRNNIEYLYDSIALLKDWENNKSERFTNLNSADPHIYVHLAIVYHKKYWITSYGILKIIPALMRFIDKSQEARGAKTLQTLSEIAGLFPLSVEAYTLFLGAYLRVGLFNEAAEISELFGGYLMGGMACFYRGDYIGAAENFTNSLVMDKDEKSRNNTQGYLNLVYGLARWEKQDFEAAYGSFRKSVNYFKNGTEAVNVKLADYLANGSREKKNIPSSPLLMKLQGELIDKEAVDEINNISKRRNKEKFSAEISKAVLEIKSKAMTRDGALAPINLRQLLRAYDAGGKDVMAEQFDYELIFPGKKRKLIPAYKAEEMRENNGGEGKRVFIDDERKDVFVDGKHATEFKDLMYAMLVHFAIHDGIGGNSMILYKAVWGDDIAAERNRDDAVQQAVRRFRKILIKYNLGKVPGLSKSKYHDSKTYIMKPEPRYCILRKIDKEKGES